jgi:hypothetical protein
LTIARERHRRAAELGLIDRDGSRMIETYADD